MVKSIYILYRFAYLAALTRADTIMVARRFVLAHKAGFIDTRRRGWRRRTGNHLL